MTTTISRASSINLESGQTTQNKRRGPADLYLATAVSCLGMGLIITGSICSRADICQQNDTYCNERIAGIAMAAIGVVSLVGAGLYVSVWSCVLYYREE